MQTRFSSRATVAPLQSRPGIRVQWSIAVLALIVAVYVVGTTLIIVHKAHFAIPLFDGWDHWRSYALYQSYPAFLFVPHNEHRIAVPRLFFLLDHLFFQARGTFVLVCNLLFQAGSALLLFRLAGRAEQWARPSLALGLCAIAATLFSAQQFTNLTWPFQIQFGALYCTAIGAIVALVQASSKPAPEGGTTRPEPWVALAGVLAVCAAYSMANGVFVGVLLCLLSVWLRLPPRFRVLLCIDAGLIFVVYLYGYTRPAGHISPLDAFISHLPAVLTFSAAFLGSPADAVLYAIPRAAGLQSDTARSVFAALTGATGALAAVCGYILLWKRRERFNGAHAALLHVAIFILATAGVVGLGRVNFPLVEALTPRYRTPALIFWVAVLSFYASLAKPALNKLNSYWRHTAAVGLVLWLCVLIALGQTTWLKYTQDYARVIEESQAAIVADVFDQAAWTRAYHTPANMAHAVQYLRQNRLSIFAEYWVRWIGQPAQDVFAAHKGQSCAGAFESAIPIRSTRPGWRVTGWAEKKALQRSGKIAVVNEAGVVVGVTAAVYDGDDLSAVNGGIGTSDNVRWYGYVAGSEPAEATAYVVDVKDMSACRLGSLRLPAVNTGSGEDGS